MFLSKTVSRQKADHLPEPVAPIVELMSAFRAPWALCGGWAIDAWLGGQSREHPDVDISVFVQDQRALFDHLAGWQLVAHVSGDTHEPWDGRPLVLPNHVQARPDVGEPLPAAADALSQEGFDLDVQLGDRSGDEWVLSRQPRISVPINGAVRESPWGVPTVVPEVLLFFKSLELRRRDKLDFAALLPHLTKEQSDWLRGAISSVGHPWLTELSR
jgi:hypothetical protein